ncbi:thiopeptide-type bacteriocin biosynthesis protein [Halostreptopolyspora alba]|uniref:Thiopeptide-type bacteriocin biosynthesis domain-containing protein n=1 Tax=Halostreptopolyspora alba TaxID=2487137 RepID=A0A3N0EDT1_9ACTN|nr:hypothetical protein EFW17_05545 [Nocardiopsaceae bacterium YIM 96095]
MREDVAEHDWIAAHVFYPARLDNLITRVAGPLAADLRERDQLEGFFFLRYWDGGNHLRFRVLPRRGSDRGRIRHTIEERFARYLDEHPATAPPDTVPYEQLAPRLARWEGVAEPAPRYPDNTVQFLAYRQEHARYGHGATMAAAERHFTESSRLALRLLESAPSPDRRATAGFVVIVLAWLCCDARTPWVRTPEREPSIPHVDGQEPGPEELRHRWEAQRDTLCALTRKLRAAHDAQRAGSAEHGHMGEWTRSITTLLAVLRERYASGAFTPPVRGWDRDTTLGRYDAVAPVIDICAHLFCNRIGVSPTEENYLRLLAARALRETG